MDAMEKEFNDLVPTRNLKVEAKHRREVFLQITLPLILLFLIAVGFGGFTAISTSSSGTTGLWRDISMIFMLIAGMLAALIPLAILAGLVYGVIALIRLLPQYTFKVQKGLRSVSEAVQKFSDAVAAPAVAVSGFFAGLGRMFQILKKG